MKFKKILLINVLCIIPSIALADINTKTFAISNQSGYHIYVWVDQSKNVDIPGANSFPVRILDIQPNTTAKLDYSYTNVWDKNTQLDLKFCTTPSQACLDAVGEYSSFTITPDISAEDVWMVSQVWSGIVFPHQVNDNIYTFNKMKWSRNRDFPQRIIFKSKRRSRRRR